MTDTPYVVIKDHSEYLTVKLPSLQADRLWERKPNHTPEYDSDSSYLLNTQTKHLVHPIVYPDNFKYKNLLTYLKAEQPELLI